MISDTSPGASCAENSSVVVAGDVLPQESLRFALVSICDPSVFFFYSCLHDCESLSLPSTQTHFPTAQTTQHCHLSFLYMNLITIILFPVRYLVLAVNCCSLVRSLCATGLVKVSLKTFRLLSRRLLQFQTLWKVEVAMEERTKNRGPLISHRQLRGNGVPERRWRICGISSQWSKCLWEIPHSDIHVYI